MDAKVIILLVFILFGMIVAYMVANGMVDLTSIFSRVTKSQAEENLGGVKLQIDSPVPGVYYQATGNALELVKIVDSSTAPSPQYEFDMAGLVKISGKNLNGKTLTISVASPNWHLEEDANADGTFEISAKTVQLKIMTGATNDNDNEYFLVPAGTTDLDTWLETKVGDNTGTSSPGAGERTIVQLVRQTGSGIEPFDLPEFVELIFAIGETAKAEVTIVAEP